ncbi:MAG TPA: hypothetical protein VHD62_18435 [Opitutaceae bacterium]|nr:hypothetical protein [Opitutaceae bacterium]
MKSFFISISLLVATLASLRAVEGQTAAGHWEGAIALPNAELAIEVDLSLADGSWRGTIDIPAQHVKGAKLEAVKVENAEVAFALPGIPGNPRFVGRLSDDQATIAGDFSQGGGTFPFRLERKRASNANSESTATESKTIRRLRAAREGDKPGMAIATARRRS